MEEQIPPEHGYQYARLYHITSLRIILGSFACGLFNDAFNSYRARGRVIG
jgi:hypothetical protein